MSWVLWVLLGAVAVVVLLLVALFVLAELGGDPSSMYSAAEAAAEKDEADDIRYIETWLSPNDWFGKGHSPTIEPVAKWWVEILDGFPFREIGFDAASNAIMAGPSDNEYGFWADTNQALQMFQDTDSKLRGVSETDFEAAWDRFFDDG